ncbi:MAG: hypothetical protein ACI87W_003378 [Halieaceae bacterium]|jgi:hypothetical protein
MRRRLCILLCTSTRLACSGEEGVAAPRDDGGLKVYRHSIDQSSSSIDPVQAANIYAHWPSKFNVSHW